MALARERQTIGHAEHYIPEYSYSDPFDCISASYPRAKLGSSKALKSSILHAPISSQTHPSERAGHYPAKAGVAGLFAAP
jgi:hypothetical protein